MGARERQSAQVYAPSLLLDARIPVVPEKGLVATRVAGGLHHTNRVWASCVVLTAAYRCKETISLSCQAINKPTLCGKMLSFLHRYPYHKFSWKDRSAQKDYECLCQHDILNVKKIWRILSTFSVFLEKKKKLWRLGVLWLLINLKRDRISWSMNPEYLSPYLAYILIILFFTNKRSNFCSSSC